MKYITGTTEITIPQKTAISLGKFDGLHKGHEKLIHKLLEKKKNGLTSVVFTFDNHTTSFLLDKEPELLLTAEERKIKLEQQGIDYLIEFPFIPEVVHMEPEDFVRDILIKKFNVSYIAVGSDFHFGYQRRGDAVLLMKMAEECGYTIDVIEKDQYEGRDISSTFIKEELRHGNMEKANLLLGYPYEISGEVVNGNHLGRTFGIPTANLISKEYKLLPPNGVYASLTEVEGKSYRSVTNIGYKPTVGAENKKGIETYIFDFSKDIYGENIVVQLCHYIRKEQKFSSVEELKMQMEKDVLQTKTFFEETYF